MGLLSEGTPLSWPASAPYRNRVKRDGIEQFLSVYHAAKDFKNHELKWGDEVEYQLVYLDRISRKATLSLRAPQLLEQLQKEEHAQPEGSSVPVLWRPEYANWMIEGTPGIPYRCYAADLVNVERNMALRRTEVAKLLRPGETVLTITAFPRVGCETFTTPPALPFGPVARSFFTSDDVINPHPRFPTLTRNIRTRRGDKVHIQLPLFMDKNTQAQQPLVPRDEKHMTLLKHASDRLRKEEGNDASDLSILEKGLNATVDRGIVMDSSAFGMGSCCLQVTIQGHDMSESRHLYDQLAVMAPLMLALTAATPAIRGLLADTDVRWDVVSAAMDDRTNTEVETGAVLKPRYSSIDCYLSSRAKYKPETYNDLPVPIDENAYDRLVQGGVDHMLAQHIAHLYIRDPLVIYKEGVEQDNSKSTDHFENIQSTNWNTVRFKLPPPGTDIGWRTEFRSMEVGLTDFENAAFSVFMVILSRVILAFNLDFYIPMSKVDTNMNTAHIRDAVNSKMFYFRKNVFRSTDGSGFLCACGHIHNVSLVGGQAECENIDKFCKGAADGGGSESDSDPYELMTMDEIFNGKPLCRNGQQQGFEFAGLVPLMRGYLDALNIDLETRSRLFMYLDFVSRRASGELFTNARYIRNFIHQHPEYRQDSVVNDEICFDLMKRLEGITNGEIATPELLGEFYEESLSDEAETPDTMMERMQKKMEGPEAALLEGSAMPMALRDTIASIALDLIDRGCRC